MGINPSFLLKGENKILLQKDVPFEIHGGDKFSLLVDQFPFELEKNWIETNTTNNKKRKIDEPSFFPSFFNKENKVPKTNASTTPSSLPPCPYGDRCFRKNADHFKEYSHPSLSTENPPSTAFSVVSKNPLKKEVKASPTTTPSVTDSLLSHSPVVQSSPNPLRPDLPKGVTLGSRSFILKYESDEEEENLIQKTEKKYEVVGSPKAKKPLTPSKSKLAILDLAALKVISEENSAHKIKEGMKSLAFPSLGTGLLQFDKEKAAKIACQVNI